MRPELCIVRKQNRKIIKEVQEEDRDERRQFGGLGQEQCRGFMALEHPFFSWYFFLPHMNKHQVWDCLLRFFTSRQSAVCFYKSLFSLAQKFTRTRLSILCVCLWMLLADTSLLVDLPSQCTTWKKRTWGGEKKWSVCKKKKLCLLWHQLNSSFLAGFGWGMTDIYTDSSCPNMNAARRGLAVAPHVP